MRFPIGYSRPSLGTSSSSTSNAAVAAAVAAAEARRRRMPMIRRRRISNARDSGFVPPPLPPDIINQRRLVFLFFKKLQKSDVNNVGRIVLPKLAAEIHLPRLLDNESYVLPVHEIDGGASWSFKYRYWPNNQSRMYVIEGTAPFVRKYGLETGDYMLMYKDMVTWNYVMRPVKASEAEGCANKDTSATEGNNADNVVLDDGKDADADENAAAAAAENNAADGNDDAGDNHAATEAGAFDLPHVSNDFPKTESVVGTSSENDYDNYFTDILNSFSSWDEIKDYY